MTLGKALIFMGAILIGLGFVVMAMGGLPGRFPGDILIQKKNFTFYFPLGACIALSLVLTLAFWFFGKR